MKIIGFAGKSGSGKSTAAALMTMELVERGFVVTNDTFVKPARRIVAQANDIFDKIRLRPTLQHMCFLQRCQDGGFFVEALAARHGLEAGDRVAVPPCAADYLVLSDVRFRDEAEFCRRYGRIVFVHGSHWDLSEEERRHESELAVDALAPDRDDWVLANNAGLYGLRSGIEEILNERWHLMET